MDIVIIANFCLDFSNSDNGRFSYLAAMLSSQGHNVEIITSRFYHGLKKHRENLTNELPYKVTLLDEPGYPTNVCLRRFYSHWVWGRNVITYLKKRKKPDVAYCAIPSLTGPFQASRFCKKQHIRFVIDIQDLWPEAFQMVINIPVLSKMLFLPFKLLADTIYRNADNIVAVSSTYVNRALQVNNKCKRGYPVFLGTQLSEFDKYKNTMVDFVRSNEKVYFAYCGTLGTSYDIKCVIDALTKLNNKKYEFVVMGDGPLKEEFENYAKLQGIHAQFLGRLSFDEVCSVLDKCDININPIVGLSVASIINKHADYAASGKPVINTQNSQEYIRLIDEYEMGFTVPAGDSSALADKMDALAKNEELRKWMGLNARRCAEERFDREQTYMQIVDVIQGR